ncbi:helix-turn-helix domain-containing protein [Alkalicoccobacillus porphyridii]|uniref:Transposase n=1 Tax=Alkalicoccobacillus porphyridii TaxID=2597270 RepID=A0A553ZT13_9BACI|nr:helix-turn-helix domain-containing protein [Alkalicoccobacillus porphyridii]TSB44600.1 transposase [Alkalicoccobacillus porphyridii]
MSKYSEEFKRQLVEEYLRGSIGYDKLAKKHGMPASSLIRRWVNAFRDLGQSGLTPKRTPTAYPVQFKRDVLHFIKLTGASHQEAASHFGLNNASLITSWSLSRENLGMEGLKQKPKGRPSMSKHSKKKPSKLENKQTREQELERENEALRLENTYLKKLKAFREDPEKYLEKHKQRWHSNSKKNSD